MAENTKKESAEKWTITVKNNPNFVGKGAGGVQFANGRAETTNKVLANWFNHSMSLASPPIRE